MRAIVMNEFKESLGIENVKDPIAGPNDAVIRIEATGICRSDWHAWQGDWTWIGLKPELPVIPGHEFGGEVVELGKNVTRFHEGDKITAPFHYACGHCEFCLKGRTNLCLNLGIYGFNWDGTYAEYLLIKDADVNMVLLPDNVAATTAAALGCRFMTGYHGIARGRVGPGEWVAIQGAGGVGLSAIQTANAVGAQVIAVDITDDKLQKAKEEGAHAVVNSTKENVSEAIKEITGGGAHVGIDALGIQETISNSVNSLRKGGRHVQLGLTGSAEGGIAELPIDNITASEIEIIGSLGNPHPQFPGLMSLVAQGRLNPQSLIEREVSLDDVNEVFDKMSNYQTKGFNIITTF